MVEESDEGQIRNDIPRFRLAAPADTDTLADLRWRLATDDSPIEDFREKTAFVEAFRCALPAVDQHEKIIHFVAESGARVVAAMSIVKVTKIPRPGDLSGQWGYLTNVYTLPEFRRRGIGAGLLAEARRWAQAQKLELLVVWPSERSYAFYQRAGFRSEHDPLVLKILEGE